MESGDALRRAERLLAMQYGSEDPPSLVEEDLESDDLAEAEHWIQVYTELLEFTRGLAGEDAPDHRPTERRALTLQARVQELHLRYWTDRLTRLRQEGGAEQTLPGETVTKAAGSHSDALRVLLIEDDTEFAEMCRLRLEADGYTVEWAPTGRDGLRLIHTWEPDLVFLDVRMPEMDGLEVLRALRGDPATASVPVVVLTNYSEDGMRREGERLGILEWRLKIDTTPSGMSTWMKRWSGALVDEPGPRDLDG